MTTRYGGVIDELVSGEWVEPATGRRYTIPPQDIVIAESLDGAEAALVVQQHAGKSMIVVSDPFTRDALGKRVYEALKHAGANVGEFVWQTPDCSEQGVTQMQAGTRGAEVIIAVGSGTINDTVKYTSYLDGRDYSVFATSPMNAFTTNTASVSFGGFKKSITCHGAKGIYFDLSVLANCPGRLKSAAFADVICRTTAQVDWLMSHLLFDTPYVETPYTLLAYDEDKMIDHAASIVAGEIDALGMLTRISAIMGLGTCFTQTTHSGSMAEHMISHYIDMFAGEKHPRTSHGEQVGVATLTLSKLQNKILQSSQPPVMHATHIPQDRLAANYGADMAVTMVEQTSVKALDNNAADQLNRYFDKSWPEFSTQLEKVMQPYRRLRDAMADANCQLGSEDLGLEADFYCNAVRDARYIRDRFTMLDLADDSDQLGSFSATAAQG